MKLEFNTSPKPLLMFKDSLLMIKRSTTHIVRNTDQLLGAFFQPIMFLVLFASVFGGSIEKALPEGISYINFLMAGIVVQTAAFGCTGTALSITNDMQRGIMDRFRSLPMANSAVLAGHVVADIFRNAISTIVMIVSGFVIGFRPKADALEWMKIIGILLLFTLTFSWIMAVLGVLSKSVEAVQWLTFVIIFPLTFASSAFTPTAGMNKYLRYFAENQPITQVVEAVRSLILGTDPGTYVRNSILWCVAILILVVPIAAKLYRAKTMQ